VVLYSELTRLTCGDYNPDSRTLAIKLAKGDIRHVVLTDDADRCFATWTAGKAAQENVFLRSNGTYWDKSQQVRPLGIASISPAVSFHVLRQPMVATWRCRACHSASLLGSSAIPYADDRKALCASRTELCRGYDPGEVSKPWDQRKGWFR